MKVKKSVPAEEQSVQLLSLKVLRLNLLESAPRTGQILGDF